MQRHLLVPTIRRYARRIRPDRHEGAAHEVVRQVLGACPAERAEVSEVLAAKYPRWAETIVRACVVDELFDVEPNLGEFPSAIGARLADGKPRFAVGRHLASGSSGSVFVGLDRTIGAAGPTGHFDIVIKFLPRASSSEEGWRREAELASRVSARCGVRVIDAGLTPSGHGYIAMERVDGASLFALGAQEEVIAPAHLGNELIHVATAIDSLHRDGYQHGDIHPANVMLDRVGHLRLLDYGNGALGSREGDVRALAALSLWMCLGYLPPPGSTLPWQWSPMRAAVVEAAVAALNEPMSASMYADLLRASMSRARMARSAISLAVVAIALGALLYLANAGQAAVPGTRDAAGEEAPQSSP